MRENISLDELADLRIAWRCLPDEETYSMQIDPNKRIAIVKRRRWWKDDISKGCIEGVVYNTDFFFILS